MVHPSKLFKVGVKSVKDELAITYIRQPRSTLILPPVKPGAQLYSYKTLEPGCIRFLKRVLQSDPCLLIFEFVSLPLNVIKNQYLAISYCWGTLPTDRKLTLTDGSNILISAKVEEILRNVLANEFNTAKHTLWLDALCINQNDMAEKSLQISMMANIYEHASSVEIWLDSGNNSSASIGESIRSLSMTARTTFTAGILREMDDFALEPYSTSEIVELMWSPWFERAWVVQEFCYGKNHKFYFRGITLTILFLNMVYDWGKDLAFCRAVDGNGERCEIPLPPMIKNLKNMFELRDHIHINKVLHKKGVPFAYLDPLEDILCRFYSQKASIPHDKIYAVLGLATLATGRWTELITPDYARSAPYVYLDVMKAIFDTNTDFCLLGFAGLATSRPLFRGLPEIPSWVPDFTTPPCYNVWSSQYTRFNATELPYQLGVRSHFIDLLEVGSTVLKLDGVCIDVVTGILKGDRQHNLLRAPQFIRSAVEKAESLQPYPSGESARDVARNTLIAANNDTIEQDPDGTDFDRLCDLARAQDGKLCLDAAWGTKARYFQTMLIEGTAGSRGVFWTENGYMGLASNEVEAGDEIWLIFGAKVPFIIRRPVRAITDSTSALRMGWLVCEAYVHGIMNGEKIREVEKMDAILLL